MTPYEILRRYAIAFERERSEQPHYAHMLAGWEFGLAMALKFPTSAQKLLASIDMEAGKAENERENILVSLLGEMAQEQIN